MESNSLEDALHKIESDYRELCTACGHKQYQIEILKAELVQLNNRMLALNKESAKLKEEKKNEPSEVS